MSGKSDPNGRRRNMLPPRSERKWWKDDYDGYWFPNYNDNPVLYDHVEKCREAQRKRKAVKA